VEFAAAISHELRTPLSVIQAAAYNIEEGVVEDRIEIQRYARTVRDAGRRLSKMVDQILLLAEMQSWRRQNAMPSICVGDVIEKAIEGVPVNGQYSIEKSLQPDLPMVAADSLLLRHCVQNLIVNALKYGEVNEEKPLKVSAEAHREEGQVFITVADRGPGINQSDLPHIFKPFYRGKYSDLDPAGNGLGLAVVQQLMERQLGSVTVETGPYSGCRFTLHIPIAQ
jgi:signal transduction histidine kinase